MKKLLLALSLMAVVGSASAEHWHEHYEYRRNGPGIGWIAAPMVLGGVIGYELANRPVVVEQQPTVIVQPQTVLAPPPLGYHWAQVIDPVTNTQKWALLPN